MPRGRSLNGLGVAFQVLMPEDSGSNPEAGVDSGDVGGARAPPESGGSEKRTEREIDNLLLQAPLDLNSYLRRCVPDNIFEP